MKKKVLCIWIVGIFILSGIGAVALSEYTPSNKNIITISETILCSQPIIEKYDENYIQLSVKNKEAYIMHPGKPLMPKIEKHIELPFGAQNIAVQIVPQNTKKQIISEEIVPAPVSRPLTINKYEGELPAAKDETVYSVDAFYPLQWYRSTIGIGLNKEMKRVTHLSLDLFPVRYNPITDELYETEMFQVNITYAVPDTNSVYNEYDLLIIAPSEFSTDLQPLITHKDNFNVKTLFKTTEEIYDEYEKRDNPEEIKYYIKDMLDQYNLNYVLLVGGLNSLLYAEPRDTQNHGTKDWHVPVRYTNMEEAGEPGIISDLYYADIYKYSGNGPVFDDWDSNGNDIFAEWGDQGDDFDLYPDVAIGRLACRNTDEVKTVVNKIITYEQNQANPSWFKKIIGVAGDGFLDQFDLNFQWDTKGLPEGEYTIYAQSNNDEGQFGPITDIQIQIDKSKQTQLTLSHDDHLLIENFPNYPYSPIAEIVSVSDGDVLGNEDFFYSPSEGEAYLNEDFGWANVEYRNDVLFIRGKSYDPKLYGDITDIHVWIENSKGEQIFSDWRNETKTYSEGDWTVGDKLLHGRAGAFYYMPNDFEKIFLSSANGQWTEMTDVIKEVSKGAGFLFCSGHGSPGWWGNHFPGIPGNRKIGEVEGLAVVNSDYTFPFLKSPILPMNKLSNSYKLPVLVVGGCHNSMFSVSLIPSILDLDNSKYMHTYGRPTPECWSWYPVKLSDGGAIASIGNTGFGYGILGEWCTTGGYDNWITTEFFKQYGTGEQTILGELHSQTISNYIHEFGKKDSGDVQTVQQWVLLGDPSLKIGGYE